MVNLNGIKSVPTEDGKVTLKRKCSICGAERTLTVKQEELLLGLNAICCGALVQDAFPTWTPSDREFFLMTSTCSKCWDNM